MKAVIYLEDGTLLIGKGFGASGTKKGEIIFNTGLTGYQEILTDPSYAGQIVVMTYPHIGNYGINFEDNESRKIFLEGFVVKELERVPSNWRSKITLEEFLYKNGVIGVEGVDTRFLTKKIREKGAMRAIITTEDMSEKDLKKIMDGYKGLVGVDLVKDVTCKEPYDFYEDTWKHKSLPHPTKKIGNFKVCVYDFGVKLNILRSLVEIGCKVKVFPASTSAEEILKENPDGVVLSNGPGDPEPIKYAQENIKKIIGKVPILGICLGHQLISLSLGGKTYKLKFGHHSTNHPVKNLLTGRVEITSQNHGFAVDMNSLKFPFTPTHISLNDGTFEGFISKELKLISVQYHPESSPGPHDSFFIFEEFGKIMINNE